MRLLMVIFVCGATLVGHAMEPASAAPVRLTGAFQAAGAEVARQTGSVPGMIWDSNHPDNGGLGTLEVSLPAVPARLDLNLTGYPGDSRLRVSLLSPDRQRELKLGLRSPPGSSWGLYSWKLPAGWSGKPAVLRAEDDSPALWIGVGLPESPARARGADWSAIWSSLGAVLLTILPFFTALVLLQPRFGPDQPLHVTLALVASGLFALAVFFGFYFSHQLGLALIAAGLLAAVWAGAQFWGRQPVRLDRFVPLLAVLSLAVLVVATLYLYGGSQSPGEVPAGRHDMNLPPDNRIPEFFADKIYRQEPLRPFLGDWLTSDRPPLQAGGLLVSLPWVASPAGKIAAALACQLGVYAGLWVLLTALGVARRPAQLCLLACVTSGFFLLNTLYAWPKLLPAGYLLCATGLLFRLGRRQRRATGAEIVALGACAALAMLGHGGSFFGLLALGIVHALRGGWRDHRLIAGGAAVALLLFAPWMAYQHWADPPGDRLLKYHLANRREIDPRGALPVIAEAYRQASGPEIIRNKWSNVRVLAGDYTHLLPGLGRALIEFAAGEGSRAWWRFSNALQGGQFFHLVQSLGFLLAGLPLLWSARRRQPHVAEAGGYCAAVALASVAVWCALMFGPEGTVIHQGSYLTGSLLFVAAALGLATSGRPGLIRTVFGLQIAVWLGGWILSPCWDPWHEVLRPTWVPFWAATWLVAALGLGWSGARLAVGVESEWAATARPANNPIAAAHA